MRRLATLLCSGTSLIILASAATAQGGSPQPPTTEPVGANVADDTGELAPTDIIVTARRRDESVQDVPQTVNVVTAAQVEKLNLRNFTEIQNVVPGLQLSSTSAFSNQATVRGIAFAPEASGTNPSVEFYLNDAPISSAFLFQSTFDFGQFELQRGPQGTLRGRAAPSGAIAVTTRRPDLNEVGGVLNGTLTDLHARKLDGALNIPVISDVLGVRVAGVIDSSRGTRNRSLSEDLTPDVTRSPYRRTRAGRVSVRFQPTDWLHADVVYQALHSYDHSYGAVVSDALVSPAAATPTTPIVRAFDRRSIDEQGAYSRQRQDVVVGNVGVRFAGQSLDYVGSFSRQENNFNSNQDSGDFFSPVRGIAIVARPAADPAGFDQTCVNAASENHAPYSTGGYDQCSHTTSRRETHELRLSSEERLGGVFDYVVGAFYDQNRTPTNLTTETPVLSSLTVLPARLLTVARTAILRRGGSVEKSVFGNLTAHLLDDRLELSGGLRYIRLKQNSLPTLQSSATGPLVCPDFAPQRCAPLGTGVNETDHATIYTGSVKYKITPDIMIYALTGSSYRAGPRVVGDFSAAPSTRELGFLNLPSEKSKSYEMGAKTSFMGGKGRFNIAAYHQTFRNYPFRGPGVFYVSTSLATGTPVLSVASFNFVSPVPVKVNGVEGELSYQILERWSLGVNAAFADGRIKGGTIACTDLNRDGVPDLNAPTPTVAQLQAAVGAGETIAQCSGLKQRSAQTPKFSANLQSEYGLPLNDRSDLFVRGLYSFFGKTINDPLNSIDNVSSYGLLNLYAGIRAKNGAWEIAAFGKNITREREILSIGNAPASTGIRSATASSTFVSEYRNVTLTTPREFGVLARVAFGSR